MFEAEGDAAAVHGLRGRRSNRALPREVRERSLEMASDPLYEGFGPTLLAERLEGRLGVRASPDTLRRWMLEAGLWERRRRRARHRSRRPRRAALGELGQWDSSVHRWLEDRAGGEQALISIQDDATSRLMEARFVERDNGAENRRAAIAYLRSRGRPVAVYADHAGHFGQPRTFLMRFNKAFASSTGGRRGPLRSFARPAATSRGVDSGSHHGGSVHDERDRIEVPDRRGHPGAQEPGRRRRLGRAPGRPGAGERRGRHRLHAVRRAHHRHLRRVH